MPSTLSYARVDSNAGLIYVTDRRREFAWAMANPAPAHLGPEPAPLPAIDLVDQAGKKVELKALEGKVVLIDFWASWCVECKVEAKLLEDTWRKYRDDGVVFLGVAYIDVVAPGIWAAITGLFSMSIHVNPIREASISSMPAIRNTPA